MAGIISLSSAKQAKTQLLLMWDKNEKGKVVNLLSGIDSGKRKKILAEFKSEKDNEVLHEILEEISKGGPEIDLVENTRENLGKVNENFKR